MPSTEQQQKITIELEINYYRGKESEAEETSLYLSSIELVIPLCRVTFKREISYEVRCAINGILAKAFEENPHQKPRLWDPSQDRTFLRLLESRLKNFLEKNTFFTLHNNEVGDEFHDFGFGNAIFNYPTVFVGLPETRWREGERMIELRFSLHVRFGVKIVNMSPLYWAERSGKSGRFFNFLPSALTETTYNTLLNGLKEILPSIVHNLLSPDVIAMLFRFVDHYSTSILREGMNISLTEIFSDDHWVVAPAGGGKVTYPVFFPKNFPYPRPIHELTDPLEKVKGLVSWLFFVSPTVVTPRHNFNALQRSLLLIHELFSRGETEFLLGNKKVRLNLVVRERNVSA